MYGTRMNQLVAPTSFMTATSRRRAKIAMRMALRMSTAAAASKIRATLKRTAWAIPVILSRVSTDCLAYTTFLTPAKDFTADPTRWTWLASRATTRNDGGRSAALALWTKSG